MGGNIKYARKFIILKKEYSNMKNLNPKGHGKIELKGPRLNFYLNIENGEKDNYYNVILLSGTKDYELGKIYLENSNRGRAEFKLNYKDLEATGFPMEKINAILILRDENILLGNYINKDDGSIERYLKGIIGKKSEEEIKQNEILKKRTEDEDVEVEVEVEPIIVEEEIGGTIEDIYPIDSNELEEVNEILEANDVIEEIIENGIIEETLEEKISGNKLNIEDEISERQYEDAITRIFEEETQIEEEVQIYEEIQIHEEMDKTVNIYKNDQTTNYILNILSFFPYTDPFKMDLKGYNWWIIDTDNPLEERGFLPYFSYITGGNQKYPIVRNAIHANELMEIHKHYIFGLYNEENKVKFYVYGVPGAFTAREHPGRGSTGFSTWFESKEGIGYWLLYIQPSTGRIIYPLNPMIPKD